MCQSMITDHSNVISPRLNDDQETVSGSQSPLLKCLIQSTISFSALQTGKVELLEQLPLNTLLICHHIYCDTSSSTPSGFPPVTFLFFSSSIPLSVSRFTHAILYFPFSFTFLLIPWDWSNINAAELVSILKHHCY